MSSTIDVKTLPLALRKVANATDLRFHGHSWGRIIYSARDKSVANSRVLYLLYDKQLSSVDWLNIYDGTMITKNSFTDTPREITSEQIYVRSYVLDRLFALCCCGFEKTSGGKIQWNYYPDIMKIDEASAVGSVEDIIEFECDSKSMCVEISTPQGKFRGKIQSFSHSGQDMLPSIMWQLV